MSTNTCILDRSTTPAAVDAEPRFHAPPRTATTDAEPRAGARHDSAIVRRLAAILTALRRGPTQGTGPLDTPGYRAIDETGVHHMSR
jgi:hypothetical protein